MTDHEKLTIFGKEIIDENSIRQIHNCLTKDARGVLTADAHYGYGHPIGGAIAYKDKISLSGVGFDIACGNKAVKTPLLAKDIDIARIMDEIVQQIGFGVGRPNPERIDHEVFDKIAKAEFKPQRNLRKLAREQLGTVGSGNHYVDIFKDEEGYVWIGVHFGSRGFGHKTATGFIAMSQGLTFEDRGKEGSMDAPPILFDTSSAIGQDYIAAMQLAGDYAYAGRDVVVDKVLSILGTHATYEVHNHHNFAWQEEHYGEKYWVVRKGCTPAFPGQQGFIGANMADISVIVEGVDSNLSRQGLYSTVHGAGRVMSRRQAAGKLKWVKDRSGRRTPTVVSPGQVDFEEVKQQMQAQGVELRGAGADEAPQVYKKLEEVLGYHKGTIKVLHRLIPIGVAMAGADIHDPYKD
jgi:tRNA-splicing ligase RtcB (3'-phosphate/5'-hydroxy nucleic acid ligase)